MADALSTPRLARGRRPTDDWSTFESAIQPTNRRRTVAEPSANRRPIASTHRRPIVDPSSPRRTPRSSRQTRCTHAPSHPQSPNNICFGANDRQDYTPAARRGRRQARFAATCLAEVGGQRSLTTTSVLRRLLSQMAHMFPLRNPCVDILVRSLFASPPAPTSHFTTPMHFQRHAPAGVSSSRLEARMRQACLYASGSAGGSGHV